MQLTQIPEDEQEGALGTFWTMLRECEEKADNDNNRVLRHWVEQWYQQWNRITGDRKTPFWIASRAETEEPPSPPPLHIAPEIEREVLEEEHERMLSALHQISQWQQAYPLDVFPEPDRKKANEVLLAAGISLSALSAETMRHVLSGIRDIVDAGLGSTKSTPDDSLARRKR